MTAREAAADSLRLTRRDRWRILLLVVLGAASLALGLRLVPSVFPEATIRFEVDRGESKSIAEGWLRDRGFDLAGYRHASSFQYDDTAKVFLERELGLDAMNDAVRSTARIWRWSHRWYRPGEKEEFLLEVAPAGGLVRFQHLLPDSARGENLDELAARGRAEAFLRDLRPLGTEGLRFLGASARRLDHRTDHRFLWEADGVDWEGARYRHAVTLRGGVPGGYEEFVQVPETWARGYSRLRSKNTVAGGIASVLLILTAVAMLVVVFREARRKRIRWRFSLIMGVAGGLLALLAGLDGIPSALYAFDTSQTLGGFFTQTLILNLLSAAGSGALIALLVAAGENRYRDAYPGKLSLPALFTWRGLRSKEFFFSAVGGLALTCAFIAYQAVFYRVAGVLGAWSPAEVPYTDLLNSVAPWAFLLYIGFFPAVSEEFLSRAFSIPFFARLLRSRVAAILLASAIWGFGHAAYPNQPFYIRGVELLIAGTLISLLMIRTNLLTLLVWHYTVDAVYSGYLLLRSGEPYYVASAAIAGGIFILPIVIAVIAYARTGRFADPEPLRHHAEPFPEEAPRAAVQDRPTIEVQPLGRRRAAYLVIAGLAAAAIGLSMEGGPEDRRLRSVVRLDRSEAERTSAEFLESQGIETDRFDRVVRFVGRFDADSRRYVLAHAGVEGVNALWPDLLATHAWKVRYFEPLEAEEIAVSIDATSGRVVSFVHAIAEGESLRTPTASEAESLAIAKLGAIGFDVGGMEARETSEDPKPKRVDRAFAWEAETGDPRNIEDARYRIEADLAGERLSGVRTYLRLPEEYRLGRTRQNAAWGIALGLVLVGAIFTVVAAILDAVREPRSGPVPWGRLVPIGVAALAVSLIATVNGFSRVISNYDTAVPWSDYLILVSVGLILGAGFYFLLVWSGTGLLLRLYPSAYALSDPRARAAMVPGALVALVLAPAAGLLLHGLGAIAGRLWPALAPVSTPFEGGALDATSPAVAVLFSVWVRTFVALLATGAAIRMVVGYGWPGLWARRALFAGAIVGGALLPARGVGESVVGLLLLSVSVAVALLFVRWVIRDNPLAYLTAAYGFFAVPAVGDLLAQPDRWIWWNGICAALLSAAPLAWILLGDVIRTARERAD